MTGEEPWAWAIVAADPGGVTVDATGLDPWVLADLAAPWAQQEADRWPEMGLVYMLVCRGDLPPDVPV